MAVEMVNDFEHLADCIRTGHVPALSIRQPWCDAILYGRKDLENRNRRGSHRGWTLIHASAGMTGPELGQFNRVCRDRELKPFDHPDAALGWDALPRRRGGIVGAMRILDCVDSSESPWWIGPHAFTIADAFPIEFEPCLGTVFPLFWIPRPGERAIVAEQVLRLKAGR